MSQIRAFRRLWPFGLAEVSGNSMAPYLRGGDRIVVKWFFSPKSDLKASTVVLIEREDMPGIIFIKRIQRLNNGKYWVEGDNRDPMVEPLVNDSRSWGYLSAGEIRGRLMFRWRFVIAAKLDERRD